jgi:hypothetical protein
MAENEGQTEVERWFRDHLSIFEADPTSAESLYWLVKEESPGAAFLLASLFRFSKLVLPKVQDDWTLARRETPWVMGVAHMLSPTILNRARVAYKSADVLCGYQYHMGGGGGPSHVVFNSFLLFEEHLRSTRPGDMFTLVSVQQLAAQNALLDPTADTVKRWLTLNPYAEVFLLKTKLQPPSVEIIWDGCEDEKDVECLFRPSEGLIAVPIRSEQDFFIHAKMPNKQGAVPSGGSY